MIKIIIHDQEDYELLVKVISDLESYFVTINDQNQTTLEAFSAD